MIHFCVVVVIVPAGSTGQSQPAPGPNHTPLLWSTWDMSQPWGKDTTLGTEAPFVQHLAAAMHSHRAVGLEGTLKPIQSHPCRELGASHQLRLPRAPSSPAIGTSRDGAPQLSGHLHHYIFSKPMYKEHLQTSEHTAGATAHSLPTWIDLAFSPGPRGCCHYLMPNMQWM